MRVARVRVSAGKAAEFNADGHGFAPSGASQYSRRVSHKATAADLVPLLDSKPRLVTLIAKHERELAKHKAKLHCARDPKERARLERHIGIKREFLDRLRGDRRAELGGGS